MAADRSAASEDKTSEPTPSSSRYDVVGTSGTAMDELGRVIDQHLQAIRLGLNVTVVGLALLVARRLLRTPPFVTLKTQQSLLEAVQSKPQQLWCRVADVPQPFTQGAFTARHVPDWKAYAMPWASPSANDVLSFRIWPLDAPNHVNPSFHAEQ
jgi:hypothetical protein